MIRIVKGKITKTEVVIAAGLLIGIGYLYWQVVIRSWV